MELVHDEKNIEIFKCKCRYETLSQEDLNSHMVVCTYEYVITCEICQKKVTQPQLDRHMKAVHGDKIKEEVKETVIRLSFKDLKHGLRHKSKISEKYGLCCRQNVLQPYLKILEWE
jgi:hypothetical protein